MLFFKICEAYARFLHKVIVLLGISLIFAVSLQVAGRYIPFIPRYLWTLEVTNFSLIWMIFIGSILGVREGKHFFVDVFTFAGGQINPNLQFILRIVYYLIVLSVTMVFIVYGYSYFLKWGMIQSSDITGINLGWLYVSVPLSGVSWLLFLTENFLKEFILSRKQKGA
ncbi:MAG: TRAP transporter small permease subunit [Spirochaetes bacterium]|nr:TRAP transporter small permease subunit [Spirochaetota bacterium]